MHLENIYFIICHVVNKSSSCILFYILFFHAAINSDNLSESFVFSSIFRRKYFIIANFKYDKNATNKHKPRNNMLSFQGIDSYSRTCPLPLDSSLLASLNCRRLTTTSMPKILLSCPKFILLN